MTTTRWKQFLQGGAAIDAIREKKPRGSHLPPRGEVEGEVRSGAFKGEVVFLPREDAAREVVKVLEAVRHQRANRRAGARRR
jgi:hypothetical protein